MVKIRFSIWFISGGYVHLLVLLSVVTEQRLLNKKLCVCVFTFMF